LTMKYYRILKNIISQRPILTIFDVTKLCNQRCPMCNIWKTSSQDMDIDLIKEYSADLAKFGVSYVFLQGGEPLMRKDIIDIVDEFILRGIKPTIITNGLLLTEEMGKAIAKRRCNLAISLDSLDQNIYKRMRGVDSLDVVMRNIGVLGKNKKRQGNWSITTTITKLAGLQDIKLIERFAQDNGFMYAIRPYVFVKGVAGKRDDDLIYKYEDVKEIFDYMLYSSYRNNYLASLIYQEHIRYIQGEKMFSCDAAKYSFVLRGVGLFSPCIEFPDLSFSLGEFGQAGKKHRSTLRNCNRCTPCFYNDAREIGILWRNKFNILANLPRITYQMMRYGNFF
jgi:MoaA/NifB/PqqE/SkfB family radical SAM enzyme